MRMKYFIPYLENNHFKYMVIGFGKYKGQKANDIVFRKLEYIDWCYENLDSFSLPRNLMYDFGLGIENRLIYAIQEDNQDMIEFCRRIAKRLPITLYNFIEEDVNTGINRINENNIRLGINKIYKQFKL
jgi:hypothetical protein